MVVNKGFSGQRKIIFILPLFYVTINTIKYINYFLKTILRQNLNLIIILKASYMDKSSLYRSTH
jgi:hypothetical protein